jgi:hypothetical protein
MNMQNIYELLLQEWLHTRATVVCYTYVVCIVIAGLISLRNLDKELMEKFSWGSTKKRDKR